MKRILALSGGGVRGVVEIAFLEAVERVYRKRHGSDARLCEIFDLVGGSSTGALIAAAVALGKPMPEIADFYLTRAVEFFGKRRRFGFGMVPVFDTDQLEREIIRDVGNVTLGGPELQTLLAIVTKRVDTGSPWIVSNLPDAPFFDDSEDGTRLGNRHYPLARLLRASSAAPTFFRQETLEILPGEAPGVFIDGGISPHNDPGLALFMLARMNAFGLNWPIGADNMFILTIGTGRHRVRMRPEKAAKTRPLPLALKSVAGLVIDGMAQTNLMLEWIGKPLLPTVQNAEIGTLAHETLAPDPLFSVLALNLPLEQQPLEEAGFGVSATDLKAFRKIDKPEIIHPLYDLAQEYCAKVYDLDRLLL